MPNTREKLIELLQNSPYLDVLGGLSYYEEAADHLIANGVTIATDNNVGCKVSQTDKDINVPSKWISVTERLPDKNIPSQFYLCYWNGYIRVCKYWRTRKVFEIRGKEVKVTHWMPLPEPPNACHMTSKQPPKGETIHCKDCENLMFSDCYGECAKGYKGIVNPNDTCEHATRKPPKGE